MRALAYRDVFLDLGVPEYGLQSKVAAKLTKIGGGRPGHDSVKELWDKVDADPDWFPGKSKQKSHGPKPVLTSNKRRCISRSMMAYKDAGGEPTYTSVVSHCPSAVLNPNTRKPVHKNLVYEVLRSDCFDDAPENKWTHRPRLQKTALPQETMLDLHLESAVDDLRLTPFQAQKLLGARAAFLSGEAGDGRHGR